MYGVVLPNKKRDQVCSPISCKFQMENKSNNQTKILTYSDTHIIKYVKAIAKLHMLKHGTKYCLRIKKTDSMFLEHQKLLASGICKQGEHTINEDKAGRTMKDEHIRKG